MNRHFLHLHSSSSSKSDFFSFSFPSFSFVFVARSIFGGSRKSHALYWLYWKLMELFGQSNGFITPLFLRVTKIGWSYKVKRISNNRTFISPIFHVVRPGVIPFKCRALKLILKALNFNQKITENCPSLQVKRNGVYHFVCLIGTLQYGLFPSLTYLSTKIP